MSHRSPAIPRTRTALALLVLLPAIALAADTATEETAGDDVYVVHDEVFVEDEAPAIPSSSTIATKLPLALDETPLAVGEVTAERIELHDATVLGDALRATSGVNVQSGNGIFDVFLLRGIDSSEGLVLTDGAREPQTVFFQLYNVERVEVLKGPSSFLYGGGVMGGAVNLVRKQPTAKPFTRLGLSGGSFSTLRGTLDTNHAASSGDWGLRLNAQWLESDGYRDDKRSETFAVHPAVRFAAGERTTVHVSLEAISTSAKPDAGLPLLFTNELAAVPRTTSYDAPFSRSDQEAYRFQVDVESRLTDDLVVRNKTYYRRLDWDSSSTVLNGVFPDFSGTLPLGTPSVARTQLLLDDRQRFTGNQLEVLWRSGSHNLLFGFEAAELLDAFAFDVGLLAPIALSDPVETVPGLFPLPGQAFGADTRTRVLSPYAVDQIRVSDAFQVLVGARFDAIDFEDDALGSQRSDSQLSPMVGAVFSPRESYSLYLNAGEAFAPPSPFVVGEERQPEESRQVELGVRTASAGGRLTASLALYRLERENVAIPDATGITRQTGSQRAEGLELELLADLGHGLRATLAYTWTDAELTEFAERVLFLDPVTFQPVFVTLDRTGNTPPWVPEHLVEAWLTEKLASGWTFALGGRYVGRQAIAADNVFSVDVYTLVDAVVAYARDAWRLQLNLDNLTDEETFTRVFNSNSVVPAPGFSASVGLHFEF